jgi:hypothetical protein
MNSLADELKTTSRAAAKKRRAAAEARRRRLEDKKKRELDLRQTRRKLAASSRKAMHRCVIAAWEGHLKARTAASEEALKEKIAQQLGLKIRTEPILSTSYRSHIRSATKHIKLLQKLLPAESDLIEQIVSQSAATWPQQRQHFERCFHEVLASLSQDAAVAETELKRHEEALERLRANAPEIKSLMPRYEREVDALLVKYPMFEAEYRERLARMGGLEQAGTLRKIEVADHALAKFGIFVGDTRAFFKCVQYKKEQLQRRDLEVAIADAEHQLVRIRKPLIDAENSWRSLLEALQNLENCKFLECESIDDLLTDPKHAAYFFSWQGISREPSVERRTLAWIGTEGIEVRRLLIDALKSMASSGKRSFVVDLVVGADASTDFRPSRSTVTVPIELKHYAEGLYRLGIKSKSIETTSGMRIRFTW